MNYSPQWFSIETDHIERVSFLGEDGFLPLSILKIVLF
jgi:hypothetical protein